MANKSISSFLSGDREERIRKLVSLAQQLTVSARETYEVGGDGVHDGEKLRIYNELLHRLLGHINAELGDRATADDRDSIVELLSEGLAQVGRSQLLRVLAEAA